LHRLRLSSGFIANTAEAKADVKRQTIDALARIGRTLKAAGFDWSHVVDGIVYITDAGTVAAMDEGYRTIFNSNFPARATVRTALMGDDVKVRVMVTAVK
jgi:2-iminobutanoate/2-iminopropanoate deaminase